MPSGKTGHIPFLLFDCSSLHFCINNKINSQCAPPLHSEPDFFTTFFKAQEFFWLRSVRDETLF